MSNSLYPLRSFKVPAGFAILPLTSDVYTDTIINNLYTQFACSYGQRMSKYVQAQKRGIQCKIDCQTKYLLMALYVLRNWYNPNYSFSFQLYFYEGPTYNTNVSLFFVTENGSSDITYPLIENAYGTISTILSAIQALLPAGYTATQNGYTINIYTSVAPPLTTLTSMFIAQPAFFPPGYYEWADIGNINSCIPYSAIQNIIQNCIKICGCTNCLNLPALEADNVFTPIGIKAPTAISGPTVYTNLPYFN